MPTQLCPYCGTFLKMIEAGLFCPNCGIVYYSKKDRKDDKSSPSYV